jgi:hypothetical protein
MSSTVGNARPPAASISAAAVYTVPGLRVGLAGLGVQRELGAVAGGSQRDLQADAAAATRHEQGRVIWRSAVLLSTCVMISQNRAAAKQQVIADDEWTTVQAEDQQNQELLDLSNQILALTKPVHAMAAALRARDA